MFLRHKDGPPPGWLTFCAGPLLVVFGLAFISFALVQSQTSVLYAVPTVAISVLLIWGGIQLTRQYTWPRDK